VPPPDVLFRDFADSDNGMSFDAFMKMVSMVDPKAGDNKDEMWEHFNKGDMNKDGYLDEKEFFELYH